MKVIAVVAAAVAVLAGGTISFAARSTSSHVSATSHKAPNPLSRQMLAAVTEAALSNAPRSALSEPAQAAATPTATTAIVPTATVSPYPDPLKVLQGYGQAFNAIKRTKFEDLRDYLSADKSEIKSDAKGDATCKGFKTHLDLLSTQATGQASSATGNFIFIGANGWEKAKETKGKWKKLKAADVTSLKNEFVDNPLFCSQPSTGTGSGSSGVQIQDAVNLGPDTIDGVAQWHIQLTIVVSSANLSIKADYWVAQATSLPYKLVATTTDPASGLSLTESLLTSHFNEKFTLTKPKVGSTKP